MENIKELKVHLIEAKKKQEELVWTANQLSEQLEDVDDENAKLREQVWP